MSSIKKIKVEKHDLNDENDQPLEKFIQIQQSDSLEQIDSSIVQPTK